MKSSQDFVDFVLEQLEAIRSLAARRLFGGVGLTADGVPFAIISDNTVYFVVDDRTRPAYEARGSHCFSYTTRVRHVDVRRYYALPAELLEDRAQLSAMARQSIEIARASPKPKPRKTLSRETRSK